MTVTGEEKVTSVERVWGEGVYTVVTNAEYVVVNGIIASPFGVNHVMGNLYYNVQIGRASCRERVLAAV